MKMQVILAGMNTTWAAVKMKFLPMLRLKKNARYHMVIMSSSVWLSASQDFQHYT